MPKFIDVFVELEGAEPSSKQAVKGLSTCFAFYLLSGKDWEKAAPSCPYSLWFSSLHRETTALISTFAMLRTGHR
jgi:hypothetical protein